MYFLLECCRFGDSACVYSRDKTYLPSGRWWENEDKCHTLRQILRKCGPIDYMPSLFAQVDRRIPWSSAHGVDKEEEYEPWRNSLPTGMRAAIEVKKVEDALAALRGRKGRTDRGKGMRGKSGGLTIEYFQEKQLESELEERTANFGFTEDEVFELLCQGVKPWDEDAWVSILLVWATHLSFFFFDTRIRMSVMCSTRSEGRSVVSCRCVYAPFASSVRDVSVHSHLLVTLTKVPFSRVAVLYKREPNKKNIGRRISFLFLPNLDSVSAG